MPKAVVSSPDGRGHLALFRPSVYSPFSRGTKTDWHFSPLRHNIFFIPLIPLPLQNTICEMLDRFSTLGNVDVQHFNIILWFYSWMDPSRSRMYRLYVSELRILKATWRKSRHEYAVALVKDTEDVGTDSGALYLMLERSRAPYDRLNERTGFNFKQNGGVVHYEPDATIKQRRSWFQQCTRKRMVSEYATGVPSSRARSPASLFTPSIHDSRGPTKDPVRVLSNPWVDPQDEVVAVLQLPPPSSPHDITGKQTFNQKSMFDGSIESLLANPDPIYAPAIKQPGPQEHFPSNSQPRPLYLFELIILASTLKQAKPEYQILTSNCFWYCAMLFHLIRVRHGLSVHTLGDNFPVELEKSRTKAPSVPRSANVLPMNVNQNKTGSESSGWKMEQPKDESAATEADPTREYSPTLAPSHLSASEDVSSWYAHKLGTWFGIRVSRAPTKRVLRKWLIIMEEAIDCFHSDALLTHYGHNLPTTVYALDEGGSDDGSSTLMQSDEDLYSLADSGATGNWSRNTSLSSLGIGRFDVTLPEANGLVDNLFSGIWA